MPVIQQITSASSGSAYVPTSRTLTINGTAYDLTADRNWIINGLSGLIANSPLVFNVGTSTLSIPAATSSVNGYLTSTDWLTFSSKQSAITLTTTGNNGSATLIGATLNIPTYTLVGLGGMSNPFTTGIGQLIYSNGAGAPLSLAPNTSTTKKYLTQTGDGTNSNAPVWEVLNAITGSGFSGQIAFWNGSSSIGGDADLYWDNLNKRLGIGNTTPAFALSILRNENTTSGYEIQNTSTGGAANAGFVVRNSTHSGQIFKLGTGYTTYKTLVANDFGVYNAGAGDISFLNDVSGGKIKFTTGTSSVAQVTLTANGRLLLGTTSEATNILEVNGNTRLTGSLIVTTLTGVAIGNGASVMTAVSGTANQLLRRNAGNTAYEFFTPSYLVPTDIIATTPLVWNSGTKTMSIPAASNTTNGYLSSTDWLTFSSKQPAITLTTTGNSGSATLVGATLNIPTYTLVGLGGMSNPFTTGIGQLIYSNGAGAPLRLAPNTTTTKKYLAMTGDGTNGDAPFWDTISGITGTGTTNYIPKFTSSSAVGNSLIYDTGTNIGINTATPTTVSNYISLHIVGGPSGALIRFSDSTAANRGTIYGSTAETAINAVSQFNLYVDNNSTLNATSSGNVKIGGLNATAKFEVNNGSLATSGSGFMVSAGLTNGRLETYDAGSVQCIHTYFDAHSYEISAGSTSGWVSGLVITGRNATLLPDRVAIYTRSTQRFQIGGNGQLQLNNYTSASSFTGTPTAYLACDSSGNIITSNPSSGRITRLAFSAEVPNTWSNMPNTLQFFDSSSAYVTQIDLSAYNQVRLIVNKQGTAGATGSKLLVRYQATTGSPFTESSYLAIGTSEVSVAVDTTNTIITSSWIDLASGAKSDVWVALMGIDGDTTADPVFGNIYAEFRYN